ncbi:hypothetical protein P168DRAFT_256536 [Aspergillus campestris IBT 28561]|uniref:Glycan binding protein Y3-like domain-containing protein n=1 Tax=Aspergillus campestris (strain IBT 28561) TaxID=1392248 RepID=A0A2I1CYX1_ASPC2|nr:uncharacterized protein P168DRAFT_256536 [Aspergillus campestris IBT 28561]PKY02833.1 hypothetical protein P168DRAFT_256536 [Aspergillus campestris IBT 28561]
MYFTGLSVLAVALALPNFALSKPHCESSAVEPWRYEAGRSAAAHGIDKWCNNIAPSRFNAEQEVKICLEVDAGSRNLNLWFKNTNHHKADLSIDYCKSLLKAIVDSCTGVGYDNTNSGWYGRAYSANTCIV